MSDEFPPTVDSNSSGTWNDWRQPIGPYEIVGEIGHGAMGMVLKAKRKNSEQLFAIKRLRMRGPQGDLTKFFLREASILSQLRHPRVVRCLDFGMHDGQPYLIMEYIDGINFARFLESQALEKRIQFACGICCQLLQGLHYAHKQGVVHRDVKPANCLIYKQHGRVKSKLADFGLAKRFEDAGYTTLSIDNELKGTFPFMAPEQLRNSRYARPTADLYAIGACLYQFLVGKSPYEGYGVQTGLEIVKLILNESPYPIEKLCSELPSPLIEIVNQALHRDLDRRFQSAKQMFRSLNSFAQLGGRSG